jgi:anti-anti-sigma factor
MGPASTTPATTHGQPSRLLLSSENDVTAIRFPRGLIDGVAVRELYETAAQLMGNRNLKLLIDLTGVPMVSSGVMGMLVTIRKKLLMVGGQLHIAVPDPHVLEEFHVMNLHLLLHLFADVTEARSRFKA